MTGLAKAVQATETPELGGSERFSASPTPARGTGAKFEEILVVTDSRDPEQSAFWLDDDLPHVRRWAEEKVAA